jgi:lysophospholipase L1-like esterase
VVQGFTGAVIGDSRASRVGGPPPLGAGPDDAACGRSADSLADEVGALLPTRVLNLACAGASVTSGLRGPQLAGDRVQPPQVGRLKQVDGLRFVVVMIGPNDVNWADFLRYCYAADDCSDNFSQGEFTYRLAEFDREYGYLLQDLNDLPGQPEIIVVTSYSVFEPTAACADARGPAEAKGLDPAKIELLNARNEALNAILVGGAQKYGFAVARPQLTPLCAPTHGQLGADLQGLTDREPFHPTAVGVLRTASVVTRLVPLEATR